MNVDLTDLFKAMVSLIAALIITVTPYIIMWMERKLKVDQNAQVQALNAEAVQAIDAGVKRAAGIAYNYVVANGGNYLDPVVKNSALAMGLNHMISSFPDKLALVGLDQAGIIRMVDGELGKLAASDPSISLVPTATTTITKTTDTPTGQTSVAVQGPATVATPATQTPVAPIPVAVVGQGAPA